MDSFLFIKNTPPTQNLQVASRSAYSLIENEFHCHAAKIVPWVFLGLSPKYPSGGVLSLRRGNAFAPQDLLGPFF
jgi:hypothetical protein